ncbi:hypothetical protein RhiirB3_452829 [Rhizophagus irregularis]|nr:hypothetical protein RhiirB3_452829 [Rhizophagus irregularis]
MIQRYAIAQRLQVEFDQLSVANHSSSSESSSSRLSDSSLEENRNRFKRVFNSNREGDSLDYMFETVRCEIRQLTGEKIGKGTVKSFYYSEGSPKYDIVMLIMRWVNNKEYSDSGGRKKAKEWNDKRPHGQIHVHQPITGNGNICISGNNNFTGPSSKLDQESDDDFLPPKNRPTKQRKQLSLSKVRTLCCLEFYASIFFNGYFVTSTEQRIGRIDCVKEGMCKIQPMARSGFLTTIRYVNRSNPVARMWMKRER